MRTPEAERPTREKGKEIPVEKEWVQKVAKGLDISEFEAFKIIRRNNSLPIVEMVNLPYREEFEDGSNTYFFSSEDTFVYPRLNANTVLLAKASPGFDGPVGPRPTLASQENILSISGLSNIQDEN